MGLGSWLLHRQIESEAVKEFKQTDIFFSRWFLQVPSFFSVLYILLEN